MGGDVIGDISATRSLRSHVLDYLGWHTSQWLRSGVCRVSCCMVRYINSDMDY